MSENGFIGTATYSPEDNKLRIYPDFRLPKDVYERVRQAGFIWAPRQKLFVAPAWTPSRQDFLLEMCGEIGDEDTTLVDRAEERADRFEEYSDKRRDEAVYAHAAVERICDGIPLGQPILVGHHSEKRARRDAERITNGMRKAVNLWETSEYWKSRAKGCLMAAKYKEQPDVRHRRIKGLEADKRKREKTVSRAQGLIKIWTNPEKELTLERALAIASADHGYWKSEHQFPFNHIGPISLWDALQPDHAERNGILITPEQARDKAVHNHNAMITYAERWIAHLNNRLEYERAMLGEQGGLAADKFAIVAGGRVLVRGAWLTVLRVNRQGGRICSVSTNAQYVRVKGIEEIEDYQPPTEERALAVKNATKLAPLCNYPADGFLELTKAEWKRIHTDYKGTHDIEATETSGRHRVRFTIRHSKWVSVFVTDEKRKEAPIFSGVPAHKPEIPVERPMPQPVYEAPETPDERAPFEAIRQSLDAGVKVVTAPQLFATSTKVARRMANLAGPLAGKRVLEPQAGTGKLVEAIFNEATGANCVRVVAVEVNYSLVEGLKTLRDLTLYANEVNFEIHQGDFLQCNGNLGLFDAIVMNPPFVNGVDIKHITHAIGFLKPDGRLVSLCANGQRQREQLKPLADYWEELPPGSFSDQGTNVSVALLVINAATQRSRLPEAGCLF